MLSRNKFQLHSQSAKLSVIDSYWFPPNRGERSRSSQWLLLSALHSQLFYFPMWLGTCTMEKVRGGDIGLLWDKQQSLSPSIGPRRDGRVPDVGFPLHCRHFRAHSVGWWSTYALLTARNRREGCHSHRTMWDSPANPHAMIYGAFGCKGCHLLPFSVWWIHGTLPTLLLLLLLHQQLLQGRRSRVHHGTGPDGLNTNRTHQ